MKYIKPYNFNENLKTIYDNIISIFKKDKSNIEKSKEKLLEILDSLKNEITTNSNVNHDAISFMYNQILNSVSKEDLERLNLDLFFQGLNNVILLKNKNKVIKYFDKYIEDLKHREIANVEEDKEDLNYVVNPLFQKLKKIKKKEKHKISNVRFEKEIVPLKIELLKLQEHLKKSGEKIAIIFEGRDAAGKGSTISTIIEHLNPSYYNIGKFGVPTEYEQEHWFERYEKELPDNGEMTLYDRSWYNRAVNDPVMGYCTKQQYEQFLKDVIPFENKIIDSGTKLFKFWLSITKDVQQLRFEMRQADPLKYWKFSENDLNALSKFDKFTLYKEMMFKNTSTEKSPWIIVNANDKKLARLNIIKYILSNVEYEGKDYDAIENIMPEIIIKMI
jgi:polyphosphate kinase 2